MDSDLRCLAPDASPARGQPPTGLQGQAGTSWCALRASPFPARTFTRPD